MSLLIMKETNYQVPRLPYSPLPSRNTWACPMPFTSWGWQWHQFSTLFQRSKFLLMDWKCIEWFCFVCHNQENSYLKRDVKTRGIQELLLLVALFCLWIHVNQTLVWGKRLMGLCLVGKLTPAYNHPVLGQLWPWLSSLSFCKRDGVLLKAR